MKRFIATLIIIMGFITIASAQGPRSAGLRIGGTGLDAVYQHSMNENQFIEGNLGMDFGYDASGNAGFKATAIYNFIWARPAWTDKGKWAIYAGPGVSIGMVDDLVPYKILGETQYFNDNGFMLSVTGQVGLEYTFDFPLQLSIDLRPFIGLHVNDGKFRIPATNENVNFESKINFYGNGPLTFIPSLSVRYRF